MIVSHSRGMAIVEAMSQALHTDLTTCVENNPVDVLSVDYNTAHEIVNGIMDNFKTIAKGVEFEGVTIPRFICTHKTFSTDDESKLSSVEVHIRTGLKAVTEYSYKIDIPAETLIPNLIATFEAALMEITKIRLAEGNIEALNEYLKTISEEEELDVTVQFALDGDFISDISDKTIVFGASVERAFEISALNLMHYDVETYGDFNKVLADEAREKFVNSVKGRTSTQIIKASLKVVEQLTGVHSKKRADRLLRQTYKKKAQFVAGAKKGGIGYVNKTVNIGGEEVTIFALLEKASDTAEGAGAMSIKLSPFNIKTNFNVEYDVLNNYTEE